MASVHRKPRSPFWWGFWRDVNGKLHGRSTKLTDKGAAVKMVLAWEQVDRDRPRSAEQARKVLQEIMADVLGADAGRVKAGDFLKRWREGMEGTVGTATLEFYSGAAGAFVKAIGPETIMDAITAEDVTRWRTAEAKRVTSKTVNQRLKAVRAMFAAAVREGFVRANPLEDVKALKKMDGGEKMRRPFTREELDSLLQVCDDEWKLVTLAGLHTGQRLGDVGRMRWKDLQLAAGAEQWRVHTRKTGLGLQLPLNAELAELLKARKAASAKQADAAATDYVFPALVEKIGRAGAKVGTVSKEFGQLLFLAGLRTHSPYDQISKGGKKAERAAAGTARRAQQELSFHSLRHTARTWMEEAGVPQSVIDAFIGQHGTTGRIYTKIGAPALREAAYALRDHRI